jgi:hypothetical protein
MIGSNGLCDIFLSFTYDYNIMIPFFDERFFWSTQLPIFWIRTLNNVVSLDVAPIDFREIQRDPNQKYLVRSRTGSKVVNHSVEFGNNVTDNVAEPNILRTVFQI